MPSPNVECPRCGNRWFSEQYEERGIEPHYCPRCYRKEVRAIPEPPSPVDRAVEGVQQEMDGMQQSIHDLRKQAILWKENNRYLIDLGLFAVAMVVIFAVMYVFIFVWA